MSDENEDNGIHVFDPITKTHIPIMRGEKVLTLTRWDGDDEWDIIDENGSYIGRRWSRGLSGIADFIAMNELFDEVYGKEA